MTAYPNRKPDSPVSIKNRQLFPKGLHSSWEDMNLEKIQISDQRHSISVCSEILSTLQKQRGIISELLDSELQSHGFPKQDLM